jgi:hypothetical protein
MKHMWGDYLIYQKDKTKCHTRITYIIDNLNIVQTKLFCVLKLVLFAYKYIIYAHCRQIFNLFAQTLETGPKTSLWRVSTRLVSVSTRPVSVSTRLVSLSTRLVSLLFRQFISCVFCCLPYLSNSVSVQMKQIWGDYLIYQKDKA